MSDVLMLYLFTRLDMVLMAAAMIGAGLLILAVLTSFGIDIARSEGDEIRRNSLHQFRFRLIMAATISVLILIVVPSKSDMAIIVGGKIALDASRTDTAQAVGQEVLDAIRSQLRQAAK